QVGGAAALQHLHALHHFQAVADVVAQRGIHIGDHGGHFAAVVDADGHHQPGKLDAFLHRFHESTGAGGDVQQDGVRTGGQLFGHDAGGDQGDAADGGGDIPQRVHLFVGDGDVLTLADDRDAGAVYLGEKVLLAQGGAGAGDALHLVDGAAGVAQATAAHLGDLDPAGRRDGGDHQSGLIAHAAGGMLVHLDPRDGGKVHHFAAVGHDVGE